jgi:hypothetical protein
MSLHTCVADKNVSADWALQQQSAVRESTCWEMKQRSTRNKTWFLLKFIFRTAMHGDSHPPEIMQQRNAWLWNMVTYSARNSCGLGEDVTCGTPWYSHTLRTTTTTTTRRMKLSTPQTGSDVGVQVAT